MEILGQFSAEIDSLRVLTRSRVLQDLLVQALGLCKIGLLRGYQGGASECEKQCRGAHFVHPAPTLALHQNPL